MDLVFIKIRNAVIQINGLCKPQLSNDPEFFISATYVIVVQLDARSLPLKKSLFLIDSTILKSFCQPG